jgi:hypothetical protein
MSRQVGGRVGPSIPGMESGKEINKAAKGSPLLPFPLAGEARVRIRTTGMEGGVLSLTF